MPKDIVIMSESEIDGESVEIALSNCMKDIRTGVCNTETHIMRMIQSDEIDGEMWMAANQVNIELLNLIKELNMIMKEIRPSSKALKVARESIDQKIESFKMSGENL